MIPQLIGKNRSERRAMLLQLERDNRGYPEQLKPLPHEAWPGATKASDRLVAALRSREFMCQVFDVGAGVVRLSINRTSVDIATLRWNDNIAWEDLQRLKAEAGFADREAVEIYPPAGTEVNVANMRHLWVLPERMPFSWGAR